MTNPNPSHRKKILPGLQVPADLPPEVQKFLQAVKEHLELYTGSKGQPGERFVTLQDLKDAGLANYVVKRGRGEIGSTAEQTAASSSTSTPLRVDRLRDADVAGKQDGDVLRYVARSDKWQRYQLFDSDGVVLESRIPDTFAAQIAFEGGIVVGDLAFSSAAELSDALGGGGGGALVYVNSAVPAGNTVADSDAETSFESSYTIPADQLQVGSVIRVRLSGVLSTDTTDAPTIQLRVKLASVTVLDSGAISLSTGASAVGWWADVQIVVHTDGATGTVDAKGILVIDGTAVHFASAGTSVDTTAELSVGASAQWSDADVDNSVTLHQMLVYLDAIVDPGSGGGVSDHGELEGLSDDDHPQYVLRSILTTDGDLFVRAAGEVTRLAKGSDGQVLKMVSGAPAWAAESGGPGGSTNPTPVATALSPESAEVGSGDTAVTLTGSDFTYWSLVLLDGVPVATQYVSSTELAFTVPGAMLAAPASISVKVASPLPGGGESDELSFEVEISEDEHFASVVALLHFDGTDASTTITDVKGKTWTPAGNAQLDTDQFKFGTASLLLDGSGDYVSSESHADFNFGTGDYTIEAFINRAVSATHNILSWSSGSVQAALYANAGQNILRFQWGGSDRITSTEGQFPLSQFVHVAVVRASGTHYLFINGALIGTTNTAVTFVQAPIEVGRRDGSSATFNGRIDELRITKGVARYTEAFTPPSTVFPDK